MTNRISIAACAFALAFVLPSCHKSADGAGGNKMQESALTPRAKSGNGGGGMTGGASGGDPIRPDASKTPGDTLDVTKDDICVAGYSSKVRNVPQAAKEQAYAEYGITHRQPGQYEIDHLISLELGGSNSLRNLWPQSYITKPWNAHVKDALENRLHQEICSGKTDLAQAQREISGDWIAAYKKRFSNPPGGSNASASPRAAGGQSASANGSGNDSQNAADPNGKVWVNTNSGKYWRPGTEFYGKTKEGNYMTEAQAQQAGFVAAKGQ